MEHDDKYCHSLREVVIKPRFEYCLAVQDIHGRGGAYSVHLIPYHHDVDTLRKYLNRIDKGSTGNHAPRD